MKTFCPVPAQANCTRCSHLFVYFRGTRPRRLCNPCIPLEKAESNKFYNGWATVKRIEARRNAVEAHAHA